MNHLPQMAHLEPTGTPANDADTPDIDTRRGTPKPTVTEVR